MAFDASRMTRESPPHHHSTFSTLMFLLPCQHKLWLTTLVCDSPLPIQILEYFTLWFYYHSTRQIPENQLIPINTTMIIFLLNFAHIFIFTNTIVWTFCLLFVNIIIKFFTCLIVWFATLYFVLSLQPYAGYNTTKFCLVANSTLKHVFSILIFENS